MNTPGFSRRLEIKITTTKAGKRRAFYFQPQCRRWLPMQMVDAELFISQDQADEYKGR